ncbi:MAG: response regulator [Chloroflexi bacterium]|nr:response regulator [Chloroflexota bacterium]
MPKRILLVDDAPQLLEAMEAVLTEAGYAVVGCDTPQDAVDLARETRPDLIVLDINMPGMNGWEVLEVLRLDPTTRRIPIVISSADYNALQQREAFLRSKGVELLYRPFDIEELFATVERLVGPARF